MGQGLLDLPDDLEKRRQTWLWDDFTAYLDAFTWTKGQTGTGTTVVIDAGPRSFLDLGNAGSTAGAEAWFASTNKFWQFTANKPMEFEARINFVEANVNNLSIFAGYSSAFATGLVTNANPNVPNTNMTAAGFFLPAGSTTWSVVTSIGTTQLITPTLEAIPASANVDQILHVKVEQLVGGFINVVFTVGLADVAGGADSVFPTGVQQAREASSGFNKPIKHVLAFAGAAQMGGGVYMRQLSTTAETVKVDYIGLLNLR